MQTEESFYELDRVRLRRWFPWLHLFRAFRLAIHPKAILLGCLAILLLNAGQGLVGRLPFAAEWAQAENIDRSTRAAGQTAEDLAFTWREVFNRPFQTIADGIMQGRLVLQPSVAPIDATRHLFASNSGITGFTTAVTRLLVFLVVWSLFGVGISRMAATRFAVEHPTGLRDALRYAGRKLTSSTGAVLVPFLALVTLWAMAAVLGLTGRIPGIGESLVGVGWGLALLCGLGMSVILLGLITGWPLMLCSVAVEDADAFDAFSRIYNYLFARPWYGLWLLILMLLYGAAVTTFAATVLLAMHGLAEWAVGSGLGYAGLSLIIDNPGQSPGFASQAVEFWRGIADIALHGFVVSYFWTAATIIYCLLRKSEDATPLEAITLPHSAPPGDSELPLVGMPAAEKREGESDTDGVADTSDTQPSSD